MVLIYVKSGEWMFSCSEEWSFVVDKEMRGRMVTLETTTPLEKLKMMVCKDYGVGHNVVNAKFSYLLLNQRGNSIINNDRQASNFVGYAKRDSSTTLCVTFSGAVIVSTPQNVALADANSGISMFDKVRVPILGLVENMSCFVCPHCNEAFFIFGKEGARQMAAKKDLKLIGEIPLEMKIREGSDEGVRVVVSSPGAVIVSTPQDVALADANSGISMFDKVRVPILGLMENMSCFVFPHCNGASFIFGKEGARQMAAKKDLKLIGEIPLEMKIREGSDEGVRVVVSSPDSVVSKAYEDLAQNAVNGLKELHENPENEIQMKLNVPYSS
ncbi:hypothetical protein F2Q70_00042854 [Brassica cretica]|uniref:Uncharacterized protein n=1 Tax=Brassica cretica TaxID=69181 RepID=A0A8S9KEE1_BRACR|nr:hypothetical protein F2Q70_00042854 [Brassica cretica]